MLITVTCCRPDIVIIPKEMGERSNFIQMSFFENRSGVTKLFLTLRTLFQVMRNGKMHNMLKLQWPHFGVMSGWLSWAVFCQLLLIARRWSEVQASEVSHRHGSRLACNMIYFGHHVILTIVGTEWDDAPLPPGFSKTAKNKCALHLRFSVLYGQSLLNFW